MARCPCGHKVRTHAPGWPYCIYGECSCLRDTIAALVASGVLDVMLEEAREHRDETKEPT